VPLARFLLWLLSLGCIAYALIALGARTAPSVWLPALLLLCLATLATLGTLFPRLQIYADVVQSVPPGQKQLALTFDDGPHPDTTRRVLRILAETGARATFFVVGQKVERYPEVAREIVAAGHELGLHGYAHDRLYSLRSTSYVQRDIERTQAAVEAATGVRTRLFRPPIGFVGHLIAIAADRARVTLVAWSARGLDGWSGARAESVLARLESGLSDGAILMLHDASEREAFEPVSIQILPELLRSLRERGLRSVTVGELLAPALQGAAQMESS
jgi:peptidoglycan/xylan/chitin deacetylase (PgdA/CDA1 family)